MNERILVNTIIKEHATVVATAEETEGSYSMVDVHMLPDGSNCLHYHRLLTQTFTALEGILHIYLGGKQVVRLDKGESYTVKPGIVHGLFNPTKSVVRCRIVTTPGLVGYENTMRILSGLAKENKLNKDGFPNDYSATALLMEMGDIYFTKAHTFFYPWIKWKAQQARKRGIEKAFFKNYCAEQ
jgi:quercetin dioxygenase-like cupin family protein